MLPGLNTSGTANREEDVNLDAQAKKGVALRYQIHSLLKP